MIHGKPSRCHIYLYFTRSQTTCTITQKHGFLKYYQLPQHDINSEIQKNQHP